MRVVLATAYRAVSHHFGIVGVGAGVNHRKL
jgi:hypothetical protein